MAEAFVVIGAVAAATQFASQILSIALSLHGAISQVKDAPASVQRELARISQLSSILRLIISNASYQTDAVALILGPCLRDVTDLQRKFQRLLPSLEATKFEILRKAVVAAFEDKAVQKLLLEIDRHKLSLIIAMHLADSSALQDIGFQLKAAVNSASDLLLIVEDTSSQLRTMTDAFSGVRGDITVVDSRVSSIAQDVRIIQDHLPAVLDLMKGRSQSNLTSLKFADESAEPPESASCGSLEVFSKRSKHFRRSNTLF